LQPKAFADIRFLMTRYEPGNDLHRAMFEAFRKVFGPHVAGHPIEMTRVVEQSGRFLSSVYEIDYREMTRETWRAPASTAPMRNSRAASPPPGTGSEEAAMTKRHRMFDIDIPEEAVADAPRIRTLDAEAPTRRGPMATAIARTVGASRERQEIEARIRAENDALAHEHIRLKRLGLVIELVPLDAVEMYKLVRDRKKGRDDELAELKASIVELGLSNPIRVEAQADGRYELIQGYRRLCAYRELLAGTGDAAAWGTIPAVVSAPGEGIEALYRRMVDENLVRKDISFAEMAMLALDYADDPETAVDDPEKAVAVLFRSAGYQKRSYIRAFIPVVRSLGSDLRFMEHIPRALGLALSKRIEAGESLWRELREALAGREERGAEGEIEALRRVAGQGGDVETPPEAARRTVTGTAKPARAKSSFQFDRPEGRGKCVAAAGRLEIRLDRDFTTIDRRRLEEAVRLMLDALEG
jgi:ParB family chromosome partitioning protein